MTFDTGSAGDYRQVHDGDGAHRGAAEGRRFAAPYRGGRYRRPGQVDGGWLHQNVSSDRGEMQYPASRRGYRAQWRDGFQSSPSYGRSYDPAPETSRGRVSRAYFHHSMESLDDDDAAADGGYGKNQRIVDVPNEVVDEKCYVLIYHISDLRQFGCRVFVNTKSHQVVVSGGRSEEALNKTVELVYQKLIEMQPVKCTDISPQLAAALSQRKAINWVRELFKEHKKPAAFYTENKSAYVIAADEAMAVSYTHLTLPTILRV